MTSGACSTAPPADVGERLVAEADAEHRQLGALQHVERDADVARVLGAPGARAR